MPKPVIDTTNSVQAYDQHEPFEFQPYAYNLSGNEEAVTWVCTTLPTGCAFDAATGKLSGPAAKQGIYVVGIQVIDSTTGYGASDVVPFKLAIQKAKGDTFQDTALWIDVETGDVAHGEPGSASIGAVSGAAAAPLFSAKLNDKRLFYIVFHKSGKALDLGDTVGLTFALKEFDTEADVVISAESGRGAGGSDAWYAALIHFSGDMLAGSLSNYFDDGGTAFDGLAEIRWTYPNPTANTLGVTPIGPPVLERASNTFRVHVSRPIVDEP